MELSPPHLYDHEPNLETDSAAEGQLQPLVGRQGVEQMSADEIADHLETDARPFHIEDPKGYLEDRRRERTLANAALGRNVRSRRDQAKKD